MWMILYECLWIGRNIGGCEVELEFGVVGLCFALTQILKVSLIESGRLQRDSSITESGVPVVTFFRSRLLYVVIQL
jgi:hypothetical protein